MTASNSSPSSTMGAAAAVSVTVALWSCSFPAIRAALIDFSPGQLAALRFLIASIVLGGYFVAVRPQLPVARDLPRIVLAGALGIAAYNWLLNTGELTVDAGTASFIVNTAPVFTAAFGLLFLGERLRMWGWVGIMLGLVGVSVIAASRGGLRFGSGAPYVFGAAICQATQFVLQKPLLARYGALPVTALVIWVGAVLLLPFLPEGFVAARHASAASMAALVFLGIGPAALAYLAWTYALSQMPVSRAASFLYLVPPIATVIALVWLKEFPAPSALLGGFLALSGVVIVNTLGRPAPRARET